MINYAYVFVGLAIFITVLAAYFILKIKKLIEK